MMDKILTVRQPYASALVHGVKDSEYRAFRIPKGTKVWVHSGLQAAFHFSELPAWLDDKDPTAAAYLRWTLEDNDTPRPELSSALSQAIYDCKGLPGGLELPFGFVIGWVVFGDSYQTEGEEAKLGKYANKVDSFHALNPREWKMHKGSLGLMPYGGI